MILTFSESEPAVEEAYQTRMLITPDYLRMDDGNEDDDFILMNRQTRTIYSVAHDDERVIVIHDQKVSNIPPDPFLHKTETADSGDIPAIDGHAVHLYRFYTNDSMCFEVFAVEGFLEDAVKAMTSFAEILAGQHATTIDGIPEEFKNSCDLANNVFEPARYLSKGFPVRQRDDLNRTRSLLSFRKNIKKSPEHFVIPENYEKYYPGLSAM